LGGSRDRRRRVVKILGYIFSSNLRVFLSIYLVKGGNDKYLTAKAMPTRVTIPTKQTSVNRAIDGSVSTAVIQRLTMNNTKHVNEKIKVFRDINPLELNEKADINRIIPNKTVKLSKP
jgi:hypothetical protein